MRIIAGEFRGRILLPPSDNTTRPITDRAKQSLFDALAVAVDMASGAVLDCFCGTGSMGLECLSRGSPKALFVDRGEAAVKTLRNNIAALGVKDRSEVLQINAYRIAAVLAAAGRQSPEPPRFLLAFIDPPYAHMESERDRREVDRLVESIRQQWMRPEGFLILRHPTEVKLTEMRLQPQIARQMVYGSMAITWLHPTDAKDSPATQSADRNPDGATGGV